MMPFPVCSHQKKILIFTLAFLLVSACSGGGGGSSNNETTPSPNNTTDNTTGDISVVSGEPAATVEVERVSLTGLAIKGLAVGARIELYSIDETGLFATTPSAIGTTDVKGRYQIVFSSESDVPNGVVKLTLSYQEGAKLQCDNINVTAPEDACGSGIAAGDFYSMPPDFKLTSIADFNSAKIDDNGARIINITALTSLAEGLIDPASSLSTEQQILVAMAQIRVILGLPEDTDLTADTPDNLVDINDEGNDVYGVINAAFLRIALASGSDVETVIRNYMTAIQALNGQIIIRSSDSSDITLQTLINAADEFDTADDGLSDTKALIDSAEDGDVTDYIPPVVSLGSNISVTPGASFNLLATIIQGTPITYDWSSTAPSHIFSNTASQSLTAPLSTGQYLYSVKVTDANGLSSKAHISVTVKESAIIGSNVDGDYYLVFNSSRIDDQINNSAIMQRGEQISAVTVQLATGSDGTHLISNSQSVERYIFGNNLPDTASILSENGTELLDAKDRLVAVQSSGLMKYNLPASTEINTQDAMTYFHEASENRLYPVGNGLYYGMQLSGFEGYPLNGDGSTDLANLLWDSRGINNLMLSKTSNKSSVTDTTFVGFELAYSAESGATISVAIHDHELEFDSSGNMDWIYPLTQIYLSGSTAYGFTLSAESVDITTSTPMPMAFTSGIYEVDVDTKYNHFYVTPDQSAMLLTTVLWENDTSSGFNSTDGLQRTISSAPLIASPGTSIDLSGAIFTAGVQSYYSVESPESFITFGGRLEFGTVEFGNNSMTVTLSGKSFAATQDSSGTGEVSYVKPATASNRTFTIANIDSLLTGSNGCLDIADSTLQQDTSVSGIRACTDGKTLLMRLHETDEENISSRNTISLYTGVIVSATSSN